MKTVVQFGAGNIGRGFMGQLFQESDFSMVFVDSNQDLVNELNKRKEYPLCLLDAYSGKKIDLTIAPVQALWTGQIEEITQIISTCDVVGTSVGVKNLDAIAPLITSGLKARRLFNSWPLNIFLCENVLDAAQLLRQRVYERLSIEDQEWAEKNVGFVGTSIARMVPAASDRFGNQDRLFVVADSYHQVPYDSAGVRGAFPEISGFKPVANFIAEVERKLFTHNLGHAVLAYLGYLKGYSYIHEPLRDSFISSRFEQALDETTAALLRKYPSDLSAKEQQAIRQDVRIRFGNPQIMDTVQRVGKDPVRKLGPDDRLIGSAKLCFSQGIQPETIAYVCGAAYHYDFPGDPDAMKLQNMIHTLGIKKTIQKISGIDPNSDFGRKIIRSYFDLTHQRKEWSSCGNFTK